MIAALILAASAAVAAPPQSILYAVDPAKAEAGFDLKATMHTVHGTTKNVTGTVRVTNEPAGAKSISGRIEIDARALDTDNERRDKTMRTTCLAVDRFPSIVFAPERFLPAGAASATGSAQGTLSGGLTIRDVTRPVTMAATLTDDGKRVAVTGSFDVPWGEFGIPDPSFGFLRVDKVAHAHFRAEFVPAGP